MKNKIAILSLIFITCTLISAQQEFPPPNCDFTYQTINNFKVLYSNMGAQLPGHVGIAGYPYALNYPGGSSNTFLYESGFWIGAIVGGDTLASISTAYNSLWGTVHEFYPDFHPADTIYETSIFEKQDPLIDPNKVTDFFNNNGTISEDYYPISHRDLVSQYYDYKVTSETPEAPDALKTDGINKLMKAHVISRCFAWDNDWYKDIVFYDYYFINEHDSSWNDIYFAAYSDPHSGNFAKGLDINDDISFWDEEGQFLIQTDHKGTGDDDFVPDAYIGWEVLGISDAGATQNIKPPHTTFANFGGVGAADPTSNGEFYRGLSRNTIDKSYDIDMYSGNMRSILSRGPIDKVAPGDTLRCTVALVGGNSLKELRENMKNARSLYKGGFQVPGSPNPPKFTVKPQNHAITINWRWKESYEGYPPSESRDESRTDGIVYDFDGFKVYRSIDGPNGPWNLIAQYDSINGHGYDRGLKYEFTDKGLKNGFKYWYSVTSYDIRDDSSGIGPMESPINYYVESTIPGPNPELQNSKEVYAVPNPYRADVDYSQNPAWEKPTQDLREEWYEIDRRISFMNLPAQCSIKIFTINGLLVNELQHNRDTKGNNIASWNLLNQNHHSVGSGIYYFVVEGKGDLNDFKQVGKFVIVK